jgi:hypothetical protein
VWRVFSAILTAGFVVLQCARAGNRADDRPEEGYRVRFVASFEKSAGISVYPKAKDVGRKFKRTAGLGLTPVSQSSSATAVAYKFNYADALSLRDDATFFLQWNPRFSSPDAPKWCSKARIHRAILARNHGPRGSLPLILTG